MCFVLLVFTPLLILYFRVFIFSNFKLKKQKAGSYLVHSLSFFDIDLLPNQNLIAACAAANRAIGTRKGEQET